MSRHVGLLVNEPPGPAGVLLISSSDDIDPGFLERRAGEYRFRRLVIVPIGTAKASVFSPPPRNIDPGYTRAGYGSVRCWVRGSSSVARDGRHVRDRGRSASRAAGMGHLGGTDPQPIRPGLAQPVAPRTARPGDPARSPAGHG